MLLQIFSLSFLWTISTTSASTNEYDNYVDTDDLGPYANMVAATNAILPEIADVFDRVNQDARLDIDPFSPEGIRDAILAFLPVSRSVLLAAAQVEGRSVTQDDLDRLSKIERDLPLAFDQISSLKSIRHSSAGSGKTPNFKEGGAGSTGAPYAAKAFERIPEISRTSQQAFPFVSATSIPSDPKTDVYKTTRGRSRVQSDSPDPSRRNQRPPSSVLRFRGKNTEEINNGPTSSENIFFGRRAIDFIQPSNTRVLRGATESQSSESRVLKGATESQNSESRSPGSSTFIKMPHGQALFIRHPFKKDNQS